MPRIILHQWEISPFCGKVRKMLRCKGLSYETVEYGGLLAPAAARLSRVGKLPVLDYDGTRIQDSTEIAAFLEGQHPQPSLYPADPAQRAQALLIEDISVSAQLDEILRTSVLAPRIRQYSGVTDWLTRCAP